MDPVTTAIVAALTAGMKDVTKTAVKDAYTALKTKMMNTANDKGDVAEALEKLETTPGAKDRQMVLDEELVNAGVAGSEEVQVLTNELIAQLSKAPEGKAALARFNITAEKIGVVAEHIGTVNQQF